MNSQQEKAATLRQQRMEQILTGLAKLDAKLDRLLGEVPVATAEHKPVERKRSDVMTKALAWVDSPEGKEAARNPSNFTAKKILNAIGVMLYSRGHCRNLGRRMKERGFTSVTVAGTTVYLSPGIKTLELVKG